ncbi:MAG: Crp/Fnr family transcriptional regulator [Thermoleophilia bacterium]|nr:Crp/Fnr family transcriptional regulator [Thermoleophilia bacterium]
MSPAPARVEPGRLAAIPLFAGLAAGDLHRLRELVRLDDVPAGTSLIFRGQPGSTVYVLIEGTLKVHVAQPDGKQVILAVLGPGEVAGELSAVDSLGRSATVTALEPSTVLVIDGDRFRDCLRSVPALAESLVRLLARRLRLANVQLQALAGLDADGRLARQLLAFATEYGEATAAGVRIPLRLTQEDLASLVGASRVRVNQLLGEYRRLGLVVVDRGRRITVLDRDALARRCG